MKVIRFLSFLALSCLVLSCGTDETLEEVRARNDQEIQDYIAANNLNATRTETGLYYVVDAEGAAEKPAINNSITIHYHGYLLDKTVFDSSVDRGQPYQEVLGRLIAGWQLGIPFFGVGGSGTLLIPAHLGYGANGTGSIPGNSVIIFDIQLLDFN